MLTGIGMEVLPAPFTDCFSEADASISVKLPSLISASPSVYQIRNTQQYFRLQILSSAESEFKRLQQIILTTKSAQGVSNRSPDVKRPFVHHECNKLKKRKEKKEKEKKSAFPNCLNTNLCPQMCCYFLY